jgi:hypothetical protein
VNRARQFALIILDPPYEHPRCLKQASSTPN